jgi:sigma-54 dependent transcriptional regulator, acetoin dehydrogenase operon transcriptional activator AcoR
MKKELYEGFPFGIITLNDQGHIERMNGHAQELLNSLTPEQQNSLLHLAQENSPTVWSGPNHEVWNIKTFQVAGNSNRLLLIGEKPYIFSTLPDSFERSIEDLTVDPHGVVNRIAELVSEAVTFERFDLVRVDHHHGKYNFEYSMGIDIDVLHKEYSTISDSGLGWIFRNERPHLVQDMNPKEFSFSEDPFLYQAGFRSILRVPMLFDHGVVGAILLAHSEVGHYQIEDAFLIHQISKLVSQAFFHAGIQREHEYQSLAFVTLLQSIVSSIKEDHIIDLLNTYCETLRQSSQVDQVCLLVLDKEFEKFQCLVEAGKTLLHNRDWTPIKDTEIAEMLRSKSIISYNLAEPINANIKYLIGHGFTSVLYAPIEEKERIVAVLVAATIDEKALSPFLAGLFKIASEQIAPIIMKLLPKCPNSISKDTDVNPSVPVGFNRIIGSSKEIQETIQRAARAAQYDFPILLTGETGTGKELFAKAIHQSSQVASGPFIVVNSAAIPENLLESELFGYQEGAFTGGLKGGKRGKILLADGGSLFLDEIGELSPELQAKLLRVIQEQEVEPLGATKPLPVNVRVISATHRNLSQMVEQGEFREDLFYRLNTIEVKVPPLRERGEDVVELAEYMLQFLSHSHGVPTKTLSPAAKELLLKYPWPGNVRQLQNVVNRLFVFVESPTIQPEDLLLDLQFTESDKNETEKEQMERLLSQFSGNKTALAHYLGITRTGLWKKLKRLGLQ